MGGRYLKTCRTTKMVSGKDDFLYEDNLDSADLFENNKDMESEIVTCTKKLSSIENCSFKFQFCPKVSLSKADLSRHEKAKHQLHTTLNSVSHFDSGGLKSRLEHTDFILISVLRSYQQMNDTQKV